VGKAGGYVFARSVLLLMLAGPECVFFPGACWKARDIARKAISRLQSFEHSCGPAWADCY